jgi:hypothetical protein
MRTNVEDLARVRTDDALLDIIGTGGKITDIPEELRDGLTKVLIGWCNEGRDTPWTQAPLPQQDL